MSAEQVVATRLEVQRQVHELQQGAVTGAQTMAMMQGTVAAIHAGQMDGPRDRGHDEKKMKHHAAKGLQPV
eukprot:883768-Heterocapsa_arctica.AAC.1